MVVDLNLDFCTMNFTSGSFTVGSVESQLFDDVCVFRPASAKSDCKVFNSDFGVVFKADNGNKVTDKTQSLLFSGKGCDLFINKLAPLYDSFKPSVSRCDFCFDVPFTVGEWRSFVCSVFDKTINDNRVQYAFRLITSSDILACTVNIGSRRGRYFFRIYNKTLESNLSFDGEHYLVRFELEVKYDRKIRNGVCSEFHVEPFFESYFSSNCDLVFSEVLSAWQMALKGFSLPFSFDDLIFTLPTKIKILLGSNSSFVPVVRSSLVHYFTKYESAAQFVSDLHGASCVKVMLIPELREQAERRYFEKTGLRVHLEVNFFVEGEELSDLDDYDDFALYEFYPSCDQLSF